MSYPGEYASTLTRKTLVQCPVVSGYVAARLEAAEYFLPGISGPNTAMQVTLENDGPNWIAVQLRETADRTSAGTRYNLGAEQVLAPGGMKSLQIAGSSQKYLEILCTGTTTGHLRAQIDSQRKWVETAFDRADTDYPKSLWQAYAVPGAI